MYFACWLGAGDQGKPGEGYSPAGLECCGRWRTWLVGEARCCLPGHLYKYASQRDCWYSPHASLSHAFNRQWPSPSHLEQWCGVVSREKVKHSLDGGQQTPSGTGLLPRQIPWLRQQA